MTERLHFHFSLSCIGKGNGNPLQCSCLENPGDGGAWWAAVSRVTQSQTWLKRLSSSSRELITCMCLLRRFSQVWLLATPRTVVHQAPLSLGFYRQEHWSGLPFPLPMHESEKWKWNHSVVSNSLRPHKAAAYQAPPSMGFSKQEYWSGLPLPSLKQWLIISKFCKNQANSLQLRLSCNKRLRYYKIHFQFGHGYI